MKRLISIILSIVLLLSSGMSVYAEESENILNDQLEKNGYYETVHKYYDFHMNGNMWNDYFLKDDVFAYVLFKNKVDAGDNPVFEAWVSAATNAVSGFSILGTITNGDFEPDDAIVEYYEIALSSLFVTMEENLEESIENQVKADRTMSGLDYVLEGGTAIFGAYGSAGGSSQILSKVLLNWDITFDIGSIALNNMENPEALIKDAVKYNEFKQVLSAIKKHSDNKLLIEAAKNMEGALDQCYLYRLDQSVKKTEDAVNVVSGLFFEVMEDVLKDGYINETSDPGTLSAVKGLMGVCQLYGAVDAGIELGVFLSDVLVGGTNVITRYHEMCTMADVRKVLIKEIEETHSEIKNDEDFEKIQKNCELLNTLLYVNLRGDYCMYSLLTKDANLIKLKNNEGKILTYDEWYQTAVRIAKDRSKVVAEIIPDPADYLEDSDFKEEKVPDVMDYLDDIKDLVETLEIEDCEKVHPAGQKYIGAEKDGLNIYFFDEILDINNTGYKNVSINGVTVGMTCDVAMKKLESTSWGKKELDFSWEQEFSENESVYYMKRENNYYRLIMKYDVESRVVEEWHLSTISSSYYPAKVTCALSDVKESWKKKYIEFMLEDINNEEYYNDIRYKQYQLINIDGDNIPELFIYGEREAMLCGFYKGSVISLKMYDYPTIYYLERQNLFRVNQGQMGDFDDTIYTIKNGEFIVLHEGRICVSDTFDEEIVYDYLWDGMQISSENEYKELMEEVLGTESVLEVRGRYENEYDYKGQRITENEIYDNGEIVEKIVGY